MVMHLFKRSLYFSSNFCCSSICLLRSQFVYEAERNISSAATQIQLYSQSTKYLKENKNKFIMLTII